MSLETKTYFKDDLHDYPENPELLESYVTIESEKAEVLEGIDRFKKFSQLAVYHRLLGNYSKSHDLFQAAEVYFLANDLKMTMINYLRWSDVFRFEKKFNECERALEKVKKILDQEGYFDYQDFYFQHLGKLYFDRGEFENAIFCFEKALELRVAKKDIDLISSTEFAIKITKAKLSSLS